MDKKILLISIIELFESGHANLEETIEKIINLSGKTIDEYALRNYWTSTSLDDFCNTLLTEPLLEWESINDDKALQLITEMIENLSNNGILERNGEALEKRYRKTSGFITNLIFHSDIENKFDILDKLKSDTTIYL